MSQTFQVADYVVEPQLNRVRLGKESIQVESKALEVLVYLAEHPREVLAKQRIIQAVWPDAFVSDDVLTHAISELRKAFGDDAKNPRFIQTIPRKGYRLIAPVSKPEPESRYRKLGSLGQGAMGEVFLAEDRLLKRKVALKFVLEEADEDESGRRRLQREARAAAALDHPFICKVYETGELNGRTFIAMEYVRGQTLKEKLSAGPLPLSQALPVAIEMAEALEIAHAKGIVHRDLKPSNVILSEQGHVKITDFGIAKRLVAADGEEQDFTATLAADGASPGTLPYMSPEQVKGQAVDTRSDIFSLGVLLYEMLTGVHPFRKPLPMETAAAIQTEMPVPLTRYEWIPALAQDTVGKMLAKDREQRYRSVRDVRANLERLLEGLGQSPEVSAGMETGGSSRIGGAVFSPTAGAAGRKRNLVLVLVGLLTMVAGVLSILYFGKNPERPVLLRARISKPKNLSFQNSDAPVISPDGRLIALSGLNEESGVRQLWLLRLDSQSFQALEGTTGAAQPVFSPDSQFIGFYADGKLKKIAVSGGLPMIVADLPPRAWGGMAWSRDGTILLSSFEAGLYRVSAAGGVAKRLTLFDETRRERFHGFPNFLPDGEHFLFRALAHSQEDPRVVKLGMLSTGESRVLLKEESALFAPPGYLLFRRQHTLMAQPFDSDRLMVTGQPLPILEGLRSIFDVQNLSISDNGILVYRSPAKRRLRWWDRTGRRLDSPAEPGDYTQIALSPDGKYVAVEESKTDIWLLELSSGVFSRFTSHAAPAGDAVWSPDSRQILFTSPHEGPSNLHVQSLGDSEAELVFPADAVQYPEDWSPDGQAIYMSPGGGRMVYGIDVRSPERKPKLLLQADFNTEEHRVSPDGQWIAFSSNKSGRAEVHVATFPNFKRMRQVSVGGGVQPQWRRDGAELFYLHPNGTLMSLEVRPGPDSETGAPRPLFDTGIQVNVLWNQYCVTPDGQRFLTVEPDGDEQIELILNWWELLRQGPQP